MWPFSKKAHKDLASLPALSDDTQQWTVAQAVYDNSPLIIRINTSAAQWKGHPELPIKLGFAIPLNAPDPGGLPSPDENEQLNDIEDVILREVATRATGLQVLVVTTGTMREFVFYIRPGADIKTIHETVQQAVPSHEIQCMAVQEPKWQSYQQFAPI